MNQNYCCAVNNYDNPSTSMQLPLPEVLLCCMKRNSRRWTLVVDIRSQYDGFVDLTIVNRRVKLYGKYKQDMCSKWLKFKQEYDIPVGFVLSFHESDHGRIELIAVTKRIKRKIDKRNDKEMESLFGDQNFLKWVAENYDDAIWKWQKWDLDTGYVGWPYDYWGFPLLDKRLRHRFKHKHYKRLNEDV